MSSWRGAKVRRWSLFTASAISGLDLPANQPILPMSSTNAETSDFGTDGSSYAHDPTWTHNNCPALWQVESICLSAYKSHRDEHIIKQAIPFSGALFKPVNSLLELDTPLSTLQEAQFQLAPLALHTGMQP